MLNFPLQILPITPNKQTKNPSKKHTKLPIMNKNYNYCSSTLQFRHFQIARRSLFALLSLSLLILLAYNGAFILFLNLPLPANFPPAGNYSKWVPHSSLELSYSLMYAVKEENPLVKSKNELTLLSKSNNLEYFGNYSVVYGPINLRGQRKYVLKLLGYKSKRFSLKVNEFFGGNKCKVRFFMTWISSNELFGYRELFVLEALFSSNPNGCLLIVSNSMDSIRGKKILRPFRDKGFRVIAISPDFSYLFEHTVAESWISRLRKGNVHPGEISLGQNLSNLLRLGLLYKFGGVYVDTDVIVLRSFGKLRNVIGAQGIDAESKKWTRLNNAVMIFDKGHPLVYKFIEEFALTFDGNKWGHNGPYLVSRVVSRVTGRRGYNFTVLPPMAFYPVDWSRINRFFRGPRSEADSKWLGAKLRHIQNQSYAVHLWNKESRGLMVEQGSIIGQIMSDCCIFCNSSSALV